MKYRMYSFVLTQLNPIQKGVQTTHAVVEHSIKQNTEEYMQWAKNDKTLIMLNGGNHNDMLEIIDMLENNCIPYSTFEEEDLNYLVTAIAVVADERIWNRKDYPDYTEKITYKTEKTTTSSIDDLTPNYNDVVFDDVEESEEERYAKWVESIGGENNVILRELIFSKKLAN